MPAPHACDLFSWSRRLPSLWCLSSPPASSLAPWFTCFNPDHVLSFELTLPSLKYQDQPQIVAVYERVLEKLRALPGVESAAVVEHLPLGGTPESTVVMIPGRPLDRKNIPYANYTMIS